LENITLASSIATNRRGKSAICNLPPPPLLEDFWREPKLKKERNILNIDIKIFF
jgi:hypothetical protein